MSDIEKICQEIERRIGSVNEKQDANPAMPKYRWHMYEGMKEAFLDMKYFIDSLPEEKPSEDLEEAAKNYAILPMDVGDGRACIDKKKEKAFIAGAKWMESQMPMPEDTVIFMKGVAEGRRLEREDNNKALAEMSGYEGGTESPLVKMTFTIPKGHFKRLMPIKQGDVFGIVNLTNKEGIR